jgi:hypothetical protein
MNYHAPHPQLPTNRIFGFFFFAVFAALAAYFYYIAWKKTAIMTIITSIVFLFAALISPHLLTLLNRIWYNFGLLLGRIVNPIVLGIIFFVLLSPISLITRLFGRDELKMNIRSVDSYWVDRSPPGPVPKSFKNQY